MVTLSQLFLGDPLRVMLCIVLMAVLWVVVCLPLVGGVLYLFYFLLTLPMRRNERARLFLDLLELGLKDGRAPEATVLAVSASRDRTVGVRFHLLATHLQTGLRFVDALEKVPHLLPAQVRAMLAVGQRIGNLSKVMPACRQLLKDGISQVRGALNYLVILTFCITPFTVLIPVMISTRIMPKYKEVFANMSEGPLPAFTRLIFGLSHSGALLAVQIAFLCFVWLVILAYVGGPRLHGWLNRLSPSLTEGLLAHLPWRRKRLQRDFSAMLAVLLDSGVSEAEAVTLAAEATANPVFIHRASKTRQRLNDGVSLPEALRAMDDSGELQWRLTNALHRRGGFLRALASWHEALDARAFQLEQAAAQTTTTILVLLNGLTVAAVVIAVFLLLIQLINQATLW